MAFKRFNRVKELYEQNVLEDLYKNADLEEELLGDQSPKPAKEPQKEKPYEDEDVDELARELLGDEAIPAKSKEKAPPVEPHKIPAPQLTLFPEKQRGTKDAPTRYTGGDIMGRICPVCGLKNFPSFITECKRCSRLYKMMRNLVEYHGFNEQEAVEEISKKKGVFLGPAALKQIYDQEGNITLPEVQELEFTDRKGLSGTPNKIRLQQILDTKLNVKRDEFGEPVYDASGLPIPLDRKARTHHDMNEISRKLLLSNEALLEYISDYNSGKPPKEQIKPTFWINDQLQIFNWKDVKPALMERLKELHEEIFPQKHMERLEKKQRRHVENMERYAKQAEYMKENKGGMLAKSYKNDQYLLKRIKELLKLRKFKIRNKNRARLEKFVGAAADEYTNIQRRVEDAIRLKKRLALEEGEKYRNSLSEYKQYKEKVGKPLSENQLEALSQTMADLDEAQKGLSIELGDEFVEPGELEEELLGKKSRIQYLNTLLKLSADPEQTSLFDFMEEKKREEEFERGADEEEEWLERRIKYLMNKKKDPLSKEEAEEVASEELEKKFKPEAYKPRRKPFVEPKEREPAKMSGRECPYCGQTQIFEGADKCSNCKFPVAENQRQIVVKRKLWALVKDKDGDLVIDEETGKPKRRPIPFFSLVAVTIDAEGNPQFATVRKVADIPTDLGAKTKTERESFYARKPRINAPKPIGMSKEEFKVDKETGEKTHKQQTRGCPPPWVKIPVGKMDEYKETAAALAFINEETLPTGMEAWELEDVANIKGPEDKAPFRQGPTILPTGSSRLEQIYALGLLD